MRGQDHESITVRFLPGPDAGSRRDRESERRAAASSHRDYVCGFGGAADCIQKGTYMDATLSELKSMRDYFITAIEGSKKNIEMRQKSVDALTVAIETIEKGQPIELPKE